MTSQTRFVQPASTGARGPSLARATAALALALALALPLGGCAAYQVTLPPAATLGEGERDFGAYEKFRRQAQALWLYRHDDPDNGQVIERCIESWRKASAVDPTQREPFENLALAHYYLGHYFRSTEESKVEAYALGWEYARQALYTNPPLAAQAALDPEQVHEAIVKHMTVTDVPSAYWFSVNWARTVENESIAKRATSAPKVKQIMERVYELGRTYYGYAPHRFFGVYFCKAPGQSDPANQSKEQFELGIAADPHNLETQVLMAEYYCRLINDDDLYEATLRNVVETPDETLPAHYRFDNHHAKKRAARLLAQFEEEGGL